MSKKVLFGFDKNGGIKEWSVWTQGDQLFISHGKVDGKKQVKQETVTPTNVGRANFRDGPAQALFEAESRYKKQIDKGYRPTVEELNDLPLLPMLAQDFHDHGHKISFPCYGSPKLDGVRCLAIKKGGKVVLKSRGNKEYKVKHIIEHLEVLMPEGGRWDGELYIHGKYLQEIISAVKKPNENTPNIIFFVFDLVEDAPYFQRRESLMNVVPNTPYIIPLPDTIIQNVEHMKQIHDNYKLRGFEGIMLRNWSGIYESGKRSNDLQKYKEFVDEEFEVVDMEEDKNGNAILILYCPLANAKFGCTYGSFEERKRQLANPSDYIGRYLTAQYQSRYKDTKLPQFPTGKCFRED